MKSVLFFSMHRSGSTAQINILRNMASAAGVTHAFDYPAIEAFNQKKGARVVHTLPPVRRLRGDNAMYGPFRRPLALENIEDFKVILTLRDPKDTLVSLYYSDAYSHGPPPDKTKRERFLKERGVAQQMGIDAYVVNKAPFICDIYEAYMAMFEQCDEKILLSYSNMVLDFDSYLKKILRFCGLMGIYNKVSPMKKNFKPPKAENKMVHKRQMLPNDHKRKLSKETIGMLDKKFSKILVWIKKAQT